MNDTLLGQLKAVVQRAVCSVPASMSRKRRIREELLDQLTTVYQEELARLGDETAALEQAKRRFGDPAVLMKELRGSVSRWDFIRYLADGPSVTGNVDQTGSGYVKGRKPLVGQLI